MRATPARASRSPAWRRRWTSSVSISPSPHLSVSLFLYARNASTGFSLTSLAASLDVQSWRRRWTSSVSISPSLRLSVLYARNASTGFSLTSLAASLDVQWLADPVLVQLQSPEAPDKVRAGEDVILRCHADGSGEIKFEWFRNTDRITKSDRTVLRNKRLHIKSASASDNGVYWCRAANTAAVRNSSDDFALAIPGDQSALIKVRPRNILAKMGDPVRFDCVYEHADITEWYFRGDDQPLENDTRIHILSNSSLLIDSVEPSDEGFYSCVGIRGDSHQEVPQKYSAKLKIAYLRDFTPESFEPPFPAARTGAVPERAGFEVTCLPPAGEPPARAWWLDPRGHVVSDSGPVRVDETRLLVEAARPDRDAGNYTCVAENLAGTKSASFRLVVTTPPSVVQGPASVAAEEGQAVTLGCRHEAMPPPVTTVSWLKDGRPVGAQPGRVVVHTNGSLSIADVQLDDRGNYTCLVATAGFPPARSRPAAVHVKEKLKFSPRPVNKKLELGSIAKVYCKAQGSTTPVIKWVKWVKVPEGEEQRMLELPKHVQDINGTLHFNKVRAEDKGTYTCVATSSQGFINATIDIDVIVTPKFSVYPRNPTEAFEGYPVMIHCIAEGDPKPTIKWDRNSNFSAFDPHRFHVMENGTLLVQEVHMSDEGKYGCTAGNSGGLKREEVTLIVKSAEGYRPLDDSEGESSMMTKTFTITLSAATAYMVLVIGLMIWCRYRRRKRKLAYLSANGAEGTDTLFVHSSQSLHSPSRSRLSRSRPRWPGPTPLRRGQYGHNRTFISTGKRGPEAEGLTKAENGEAGGGEHTELKETANGPRDPKDRDKSDGGDTAHSHSSGHSKRSKGSYDRLSFPRGDLHSMVLLGRCQYGEVFLAKAHGVRDGEGKDKESVVMVKSLLQTRDDGALMEFKRELDMFHKLQHENIAKMLGLCREVDPHYMILEYTDWGDLKQFLLATRGGKESSRNKSPRPPQLSVTQITQLANQVALGMEHLSNQRFVHKDLAARNCLIASNLTVKVSLSALSKDTYSKEYCKFRNHVIPLRWMPFEAVYEDEYSTKSDVYSFACLVWEVFHQGEVPFAKMSDDSVLSALKKRELQWRPHKAAPQALQAVLASCWADSPRDRPTFAQLAQTVGEISVDSEI
ncbi:inactive tyrosine-protein kinase 7-like [Bacillus rossius redtenbacheri]|uniref:inactive tyrosine-protein kinase 7-like n=1 Tax=Bacillus rossius redtenbacheri TaxID=93214 RepID=UPI002FDE98EC